MPPSEKEARAMREAEEVSLEELEAAGAILDHYEVAQAVEVGRLDRVKGATMTFKNAVLFLERWSTGHDTSNFHALLYTLISKADPNNRARLRAGFPEEVQAFEAWQVSPNEKEFFRAFAEVKSPGE